jgi:Superinfection immunity protein
VEGIISFCVISFVVTLSAAAYLMPILVAKLRRSPDLGVVILLDLTLGWCLIGWIAGLAIALRKHAPTVQVINQVHVPISGHGYACWFADGPVPRAAAFAARTRRTR